MLFWLGFNYLVMAVWEIMIKCNQIVLEILKLTGRVITKEGCLFCPGNKLCKWFEDGTALMMI